MIEFRQRQIKLVHELMYQIKVREAMTSKVTCFSPENTFREIQREMKRQRFSGAPIVEAGHMVGLVSIDDIISAFDLGHIDQPVRRHMSREITSVPQNHSVIAAVDIFRRTRFGRLPVVELPGSDRIVGILTYGDILSRLVLEINTIAERYEARRAEEAGDQPVHPERMQFDIFADNFERAGMASTAVKKQLQALGIPVPTVRRIAVICYEAEMNVVIHSLGGYMEVDVSPQAVRVKVVDEGPGIPDVAQAMASGYTTANEKIRALGFGAGMGLNNMKRCADLFDLTSSMPEGTRIDATVFLDKKQ